MKFFKTVLIFLLISQDIFAGEEFPWDLFPEAEDIQEKTVSINKEQKDRISILLGKKKIIDNFTYYEIKPIGYAVIKKAKGKHKEFTFLVAVKTDGSVEAVKVLEYEKLFGSRIKEEGFLNKFREKTINSPLKINVDIDNITGATISCKALTEAVKETLAYLNIIVLNK